MGLRVIFKPIDDRSLKVQYPELAKIEEFQPLTDKELRLAWYFACMSSPIISIEPEERIKIALDKVFGDDILDAKKERYLNLEFGNKLSLAIKRMTKFSPGIRSRAKDIVNMAFNNTEQIIKISEAELAALDTKDKKDYIDLLAKAVSQLDNLVIKLEESYGVIEIVESRAKNEIKENLADYVLNEE